MKAIDFNFKCNENWNDMSPEGLGRHCKACEKIVVDFTTMSTQEIQRVLLAKKNSELCGRMLDSQVNELNNLYEAWLSQKQQHPQLLFFTALLLAFGLTLFSCSDNQAKEHIITVQSIANKQITMDTANSEVIENSIQPQHVHTIQLPKQPFMVEEELVPFYVYHDKDTTFLDEFNISKSTIYTEGITVGAIAYVRNYSIYLSEISDSTAYDENGREIPKLFEALAYPNPTLANAQLKIALPTDQTAVIRLFSMNGNFLGVLHEGELKRGIREFPVELGEYTPGTYIIQFSSKSYQETVRVVKQ